VWYASAEIDLVWEALSAKLEKIMSLLANYREDAAKEKVGEGSYTSYQHYFDSYAAETKVERAALNAAIAPLQKEWERRGGWQRYFLCVSDGGHVHYRHCHTLRWNSMIAWMPALSGLDENGMVEQVGYKACTHCFPTAPLHPAWVRTEAAAKKASVADKLAKWEKGYAMRQKKVANIQKRIDKANAILADNYFDSSGQREINQSGARYDLEWNARDLIWAAKEVARWEAKKP
jgi:hypothetical protein